MNNNEYVPTKQNQMDNFDPSLSPRIFRFFFFQNNKGMIYDKTNMK